jgi:hypothetical protein
VYNTIVHATTAYTPFELVYGFKSEIPSALREAPSAQYNYDSYLAELRGRLQSAHEVAGQKLITNKEKKQGVLRQRYRRMRNSSGTECVAP